MDASTRDRLKAFCKVGRLFDAQRLLEEVGTANLRKTRKWTPLLTAVDRGFHSLVELLLRYDHAQWDLEKGYRAAKWRHRPDLAGLILRSSSWSAPIDPVEALATGDLELIQKLHDAGTDFTAGDTILQAAVRSAHGTMTAVRYLEIKMDAVEGQLHSAMVTHAHLGHVSGVMCLLRAGLDPHRVCSCLDANGREGGEESAVSASMFSDKPGFFASLKPSPDKDDAVELVGRAVFLGNDKMLAVLLSAGFTLNCKPNGGSPALDELIGGRTLKHHTPLPDSWRRREPPRYSQVQADAFLRAVESLVLQGARWIPDLDRNEVRVVRDTLLALGDEYVVRLYEMLHKHGAARREDLKTLLAAERMKPMARMVRGSLPWLSIRSPGR
jgi:hypothetical protein